MDTFGLRSLSYFSKKSKFQPQTNVFLEMTTLSYQSYCQVGQSFKKKSNNIFLQLEISPGKNLFRHKKNSKNMVIGTVSTFF